MRTKQAKTTIDALIKAIDVGYVRACHDVSEGGLAVASAEMAFAGGYGATINLVDVPRSENSWMNYQMLFSESNSRFLVEVPEEHREGFERMLRRCAFSAIGRVKKDTEFCVYGLNGERVISTDLPKLIEAWKGTLGS